MNFVYTFFGMLFFATEIALYAWADRLARIWQKTQLDISNYKITASSVCKVLDKMGQCADVKWHVFLGFFSVFGIKLIVLIIFLVLIFTHRKKYAIYFILGYITIFCLYHSGIFPTFKFMPLIG